MVDELQNEVKEEATKETEVTMEQLMQDYDVNSDFRRGKVVEGTVVDARDDGWLVDVGYKCEGLLPRAEWSHKVLVEDAEEPQNGDKIRVMITNIGTGEDAQLELSRWRCEFDERWNALEKDAEEHETVTVKGLRTVKGGLIASCHGIEGFIPVSQLTEQVRGFNPNTLVGTEFQVKLLEKDRRKRRLVFSRRTLLEEEVAAARADFYEKVHEGDIVEGDVTSVTSFGVFVNLGAMEGLIHISELSWQRGARPKDFAAKGDHIKVKVTGIDKEKNKLSLSLRQTQEDPWATVADRWAVGAVTEGTVSNLTDFGAFVEIEPGIEGLIHIGDLSWTRIKSPKDVLKKGQKVEVSIIEVDTTRKRISLGYKQLHDPWKNIEEKYPKDGIFPAKVVRIVDFGAFVELEDGIEGLVHISQISNDRVENPKDVLSEGQEVQARVLEVNPTERRIRLSLREPRAPRAPREPREGQQREPRDEQQRRTPRERAPRERAPRDNAPREPRAPRDNAPRDGQPREERPRRRRQDGDRVRRQETVNDQYPHEEMNVSLGNLFNFIQQD